MKYIVSTLALMSLMQTPAYAQNTNNEHKWYVPRSATMFSPRFPSNTTYNIDEEDYIDKALEFNANTIAWHYPVSSGNFNSALIDEANARLNPIHFNAALPALARNAAQACKDPSGNPIYHHSIASNPAPLPDLYYPDTQSAAFRQVVSDFIEDAHANGVQSFQQDDPAFMAVRQSQGCYQNTSLSTVEGYVDDYYSDFLLPKIEEVYGHTVPVTYNLGGSTGNTYTRLAPFFNASMSEVSPQDNTPEKLFNLIHLDNNVGLNLTTVTTLRDTSTLWNKRHIAGVYALGGHPIAPYDVYIDPTTPRFFGHPVHFAPYYDLVRDNPSLFDGYGWNTAYIDHWQNSAGNITGNGALTGVSTRHNVMATLNQNANGGRVLHVVNWQVTRANMTNGSHYFTFWIDKGSIPFTPSYVEIHRPGKPMFTKPVTDGGYNRWKVTISGVDVWAVAEFK